MRAFSFLIFLLLNMAAFAQKLGPKNEAPYEQEQRRLVAAAIEAKESGELRRSDALFSQAFDIYFDRSIAEQRAFVRLMLGDSSGYCSDLEFFADRDEEKLHKQFETACVSRDTLPFIHSGLAASRFPDVSTVQRVTKRSDGRTEYTMLDKDGDVKIRISTALGDTIFMLCDEMPQFQGGEREMYKFFGKNMKYPTAALEERISGIVYIGFIVGSDGVLRDHHILRGLHGSMDREALRVVRLMPPWQTGSHQGQTVPVKYYLPVRFTMR